MERLKIALIAGAIAGSMTNFSDEGPKIYSKYQKDLCKLSEELDFDLTIYKDIITTEKKAMEIRKEIDSKDFDFILLFQPVYISGDIVFELMKTKAHFGLWAPEEPSKEGFLPLASFVCLAQNASIAGHCFKDSKKKFKWFFGNVKSKYFKPRFEITVKALTAVKNLKDAKVGQIGKIADGFRGMYYDEREIYKTLGINVVRGIEIEDVLAEAEKVDEKLVKAEVDRIYSACSKIRVDDIKIIDSVKLYLAIKKICKENNFKAVALSCLPKIRVLKNMVTCLTNSLLDSIGIPSACEGDILSAISMLILNILSGKPTAVMDLPAFDGKDNSILLWHCGSAPFEMADSRGVICRKHYVTDFAKPPFDELGPITDMIYPESNITVFRFTGESDFFYYFEGKTFNEGKKSWDGSRGWVKELKLYDKPIKAIDLVNTIFTNNIQHHFPIVLKSVGKYIKEFAYWLDLKKIKRIEYDDSLDVD
ncbi:MAG: hypothetical protein H8E13_23070 [Actinobacteria bacterium]|nr:hypothetical protein [Actinomycetota bacterium]